MPSSAQARQILITLAAAVLVFAVVVRALPTRAELAETNYHANVIRLQTFLFGPRAGAALVGSSIFGRMLPSYFDGTPLRPVANLGIDGSGPLFSLELISNRPPDVVLVETNRLCRGFGSNEVMLREAIQSPLFQAASQISFLRAESRPSAILYSWLKRHQDTFTPPAPQTAAMLQKAPSVLPLAPAELPPDFEPTKNQMRTALLDARAKGSRIMLVRIPTGGRTPLEEAMVQAGTELGRELKITEIELEAECLARGYHLAYTDGTHMTPASAKQVSLLLAELVQEQLSASGKGP
jgi:hypothetical protein